MFRVGFKNKKIHKQAESLPEKVKPDFRLLVSELMYNPFVGKLAEDIYHKHITYRWVAVWQVDKAEKKVLFVYIGSRENAPY